MVAALERAAAFGRWKAADVRSILAAAAGAGTPHPRTAGEALVIDLPVAVGRSLAEYTPIGTSTTPESKPTDNTSDSPPTGEAVSS